jgi:hypothetical protein
MTNPTCRFPVESPENPGSFLEISIVIHDKIIWLMGKYITFFGANITATESKGASCIAIGRLEGEVSINSNCLHFQQSCI